MCVTNVCLWVCTKSPNMFTAAKRFPGGNRSRGWWAFSHSLAGKLGDCVSNRIKFWHAEKKFKFDTVFDKNFIVRKLNLFEHILWTSVTYIFTLKKDFYQSKESFEGTNLYLPWVSKSSWNGTKTLTENYVRRLMFVFNAWVAVMVNNLIKIPSGTRRCFSVVGQRRRQQRPLQGVEFNWSSKEWPLSLVNVDDALIGWTTRDGGSLLIIFDGESDLFYGVITSRFTEHFFSLQRILILIFWSN